jgi:hypothetical protein
MRVGVVIFGTAFVVTGVAMVVGVIGADTTAARVVCFILACIFLPLGFLTFRWTKVFSNVANLEAVRDKGVLARGTVLSVDDTGVQVNESSLAQVTLRVDAGDRPAYEVTVTETLTPIEAAATTVGKVVPVWVDPDDGAKVAIDTSATLPKKRRRHTAAVAAGATTTGATTTGAVATGALAAAPAPASIEADAAAAREATILAGGRPATAIVIRATEAGPAPAGTTHAALVSYELNVQPSDPSTPPYQVTVLHTTPDTVANVPAPGTELAIKIDPTDGSRVAIDWAASHLT